MTPDRRRAIGLIRQARRERRIRRDPARRLLACLRSDEYADWHPELVAKVERGQFEELEEAFYRTIPFGTAGQRGPVGAGPNRINDRVLALSVQGVCDYVRRCRDAVLRGQKQSGRLWAVVAYDTRMDSAWFAQVVSEVLAGNKFGVCLFPQPVTTPELSHAVLRNNAAIGFMVSASHNPPGDNGIKVYSNYGGQVLPARAEAITRATARVVKAKRLNFDEACLRGLVVPASDQLNAHYVSRVLEQGMTTAGASPPRRVARIVFSPLHGGGARTVLPVLEGAGWKIGQDLFIVESQRRPDPKFRGVPKGIPNPEVSSSLEAGVALAEKLKADIVLATDPDADRLAVYVRDSKPGAAPNFLLGGQLAAVLGEWVLSELEAQGRPVDGGIVAKSIVTSDLVDDVVSHYGAQLVLVGVGFKYVAEVSRSLQNTPELFLFGCEQSYGFLRGMHCRDKDGAVAALLAAELCDRMKRQGKTIRDYLTGLWMRHGYHAERATPIPLKGIAGLERTQQIMHDLRVGFPTTLGGLDVTEVWDTFADEKFKPATRNRRSGKRWRVGQDPYKALYGETAPLGWKWRGENILIARLGSDDKSWVIVRPSGTEPSLKVYVNIHRKIGPDNLAKVAQRANHTAHRVERDLKRFMRVI